MYVTFNFQIFFEIFYRVRLVSEALQKMKGKIPEIASSHVSSRVVQVIVLAFSLGSFQMLSTFFWLLVACF